MSEPFLTIAKNTSNEMVIKKSRFICSIARVTSDEAAQQFINQISTENRKATHHCYAYIVTKFNEKATTVSRVVQPEYQF